MYIFVCALANCNFLPDKRMIYNALCRIEK